MPLSQPEIAQFRTKVCEIAQGEEEIRPSPRLGNRISARHRISQPSRIETEPFYRQNSGVESPSPSFTPSVEPVEAQFERDMRPQDFSEFLGQEDLLKPLQLMIRATKERKEPLEHLLLSGLPGLGKTSLALALTQELGVPLKLTSGPALERAKDLVGILSQLEPHSLLFIDEIHRLPRVVEEYLYSAMERFQLEFTLDQGAHARLLKMDIQPFTLVGATTREALLTSAFRSRFGHTLRFEPYTTPALLQILIRNSALLGLKAPTDALQLLAERARGVPRIANRLLRRARDVAQCDSKKELTSEIVHRTLDMLGIDAYGLEKIDRRILTALAEAGRPIGLKALAVAVDEAEDTLEDVLEPWLIRQGLLLRTPQGRILTQKGEALAE